MGITYNEGTHDGSADSIALETDCAQALYVNNGAVAHTLVVHGVTFTIAALTSLLLPIRFKDATCNGASGEYQLFTATEPAPALDVTKLAAQYGAIADDSVTAAKIPDASITSAKVAVGATDGAVAGLSASYCIAVGAGAADDHDITVPRKFRVLGARFIAEAAQPASDTVVLKNGSNTIGTMAVGGIADKATANMADIDTAQYEIAASGTLRATSVDNDAGTDFGGGIVIVDGIYVA